MTALGLSALSTRLGRTKVIDPDSHRFRKVRPAWQPIARSDDPAERRALALELWNPELLQELPWYARILQTELVDVRVCSAGLAGTVLTYLFQGPNPDSPATLIGRDPDTFGGATPPFWECIPAPVQTFLREVHAGYTHSEDPEAYGPIPPRLMRTVAADRECAAAFAAVKAWPDEGPIDSRRMLKVARTRWSVNMLVVSPDLPPGKAIRHSGAWSVDIVDFFAELDGIMTAGT